MAADRAGGEMPAETASFVLCYGASPSEALAKEGKRPRGCSYGHAPVGSIQRNSLQEIKSLQRACLVET